jgi:hypothetical protein
LAEVSQEGKGETQKTKNGGCLTKLTMAPGRCCLSGDFLLIILLGVISFYYHTGLGGELKQGVKICRAPRRWCSEGMQKRISGLAPESAYFFYSPHLSSYLRLSEILLFNWPRALPSFFRLNSLLRASDSLWYDS